MTTNATALAFLARAPYPAVMTNADATAFLALVLCPAVLTKDAAP
jgi:energy-converting hydrogenase Eha subunit E